MLGRLIPKLSERATTTLGDYNSSVFWSLPNGFGLTEAAYKTNGDVEQALKNAASWACIRIIVDALARSPWNVVRDLKGARMIVNPTPRLVARPSVRVQTDVFRAQLGFSLATDGNVFGTITKTDNAGHPLGIELLDPNDVKDRDDKKRTVKIDEKPYTLWPDGEIWHMPGDMTLPGKIFGLPPVAYANKTIGTSLNAEEFAYAFFRDGAHPPLALISDMDMNGPQAEEYKRKLMNAMRGSREPVVMGAGMQLHEVHLDPHETQFIDLMRFCVEQACRFWGVPPSMVFSSISGQHMTYSNVTQADLFFLKHSLEGKYTRVETAFTDLLPGNDYTAPSVPNTKLVIDRNAVLKGDVKTRYEAHLIALEGRFKTVNEIRAEEEDPPFEGDEFDQPGVPPFAPTMDPNGVDLGNGTKLVITKGQSTPASSSTAGEQDANA